MSEFDNKFDQLRNMQPAAISNTENVRGGNNQIFKATELMAKGDKKSAERSGAVVPTLVSLPMHLYTPAGSQSIDPRKLATVPAGTTKAIFWRFKSPPGVVTRFLSYGIFNDGQLAANYKFEPEVNGNRVFPYHGDPSDNYRISLGLAPDLSNNSLIGCQLILMPEQEIIWYVTNTSAVDTDMGVRMVGYLDTSQRTTAPRFGG